MMPHFQASAWDAIFRPVFRRLGVAVTLVVTLAAGIPAPSLGAERETAKEYEVKAVFLFNFVSFVEWPPLAFAAPDSPICIGVLGADPFGRYLDEVVRGETVRDRPIVVRRSHRWQDLINCHLVFIGRSERGRLGEILAGFHQGFALTVSEIDEFTRAGGDIRFFLDGRKVRFEINPVDAQQRGLRFSAQLLGVAKVVPAGPANEKIR